MGRDTGEPPPPGNKFLVTELPEITGSAYSVTGHARYGVADAVLNRHCSVARSRVTTRYSAEPLTR